MFDAFLKEITPTQLAPLDPHFKPAILFKKKYEKLFDSHKTVTISIALKRSANNIHRHELEIIDHPDFTQITEAYLNFSVKFLLWSIGGYHMFYAGPRSWLQKLQQTFSAQGPCAFDIAFMERVYLEKWTIEEVDVRALPEHQHSANPMGGHLDGCRIGFDLGASDYKIAAINNGEVVFTNEIRWDPVPQKDPNYHWQKIVEGIDQAAGHLPRVDAIGGSSAGIIQDNQIMVASLFRSVPDELFRKQVTPIFQKLQEKWQVPLVVANDGDVSALAGALSTKDKGILGVAMGSSEAVGYLDLDGEITGQLNELAFAPVDYNPNAAADEWSKAKGVGVMYFSQQAVNRLALAGGLKFPAEQLLPERLKDVQEKMNAGDTTAEKIFSTIGVYLGYTIPLYAQFYDIKKLVVFGRVMSGKGGDRIVEVAKTILKNEFPGVARKVQLTTPDEKFRRVGQAVAAASLPELR